MNLVDILFVLLIIYFSVALFTRLYEWLDHRTRRRKLLDSLEDLKKLAEEISKDDEEP